MMLSAIRSFQVFSAAIAMLVGSGSLVLAACGSAGALGVSRTITIDANGGKLYGGLQYKGNDLLQDKEVALTFDDGPLRRNTRKILKALATHCTKGTFFMVGRMAVSDPAMVREVAAAGHTIANHTWSHKNLFQRSARRAGGEIELGISAVRIAARRPISPFFRFPYLADPKSMIAYAKKRDLAIFSIDIDSYDYRTKSAQKVYGTVMRQLRARGKGIMLFHDIQSSAANAMPRILDTMKREGYKVVHIVSKAPVTTLSNFDEQAETLHNKKRTVARAKPVDGGDYEKVLSGRRQVSSRRSKKTNVSNTLRPSVVAIVKPHSRAGVTNPFSTTNAPARRSRPRPEKDWRSSVWGTN